MFAFLFPGQGAQRPGMGAAWQETPSWELVEGVAQVTGRDVARLLLRAEAGELQETANAQLATFTLSLVILDAVRAVDAVRALDAVPAAGAAGAARAAQVDGAADPEGAPQPAAVAGHSLGEYSALVAAGVLQPTEGARLVAARGAAMAAAAAARPGTMAAVLGLDSEAVAAACQAVAGAWVANDNAAGQVVVAGTVEGVAAAAEQARQRGAKRVVPLAVGGAFHTPLMAPAQAALDAALASAPFAGATVGCVANVDAALHTAAADWRRLLSSQLTSRVRWRESLLRLHDLGVTTFIELGPGTELSGMVKRTVVGARRANVATPEDLKTLGAATAVA